eukprot:3769592-Amphidinium_carterae.1
MHPVAHDVVHYLVLMICKGSTRLHLSNVIHVWNPGCQNLRMDFRGNKKLDKLGPKHSRADVFYSASRTCGVGGGSAGSISANSSMRC